MFQQQANREAKLSARRTWRQKIFGTPEREAQDLVNAMTNWLRKHWRRAWQKVGKTRDEAIRDVELAKKFAGMPYHGLA